MQTTAVAYANTFKRRILQEDSTEVATVDSTGDPGLQGNRTEEDSIASNTKNYTASYPEPILTTE